MCAIDKSTIADRINQLRCSIKKFLSYSYAPKENDWIDMDATLRTIEEQICVILAYSLLSERVADGQIPAHLHGQDLVNKVREIFTNKGISDTKIVDSILNDISSHNQNCHGTNVGMDERKRSGKINVESSLPWLSSLLKNDLATFPFIPNQYRESMKSFGSFMDDAAGWLRKPTFDSSLMDEYNKGVSSYPQDAQPGPYHFCLLLPADPSKELIDRLRPLLLMKWAVILDEGFEDGEAFNAAMEVNPEGIQNTSADLTLHDNLTNWLFLNGPRGGTSKADLRGLHKKLIKKQLPERNLVIVDLVKDKKKSLEYIKQLWQFVQSESRPEPSELTSILTIDKSSSLKQLMETEEYKLASLSTFNLSPEDFLSIATSERLLPGPTFYGDITKGLNYAEYHGAGIKFLDSDENREQKSHWDEFYAGRQITVKELEMGKDVSPRGKEKLLQDFENALREAIKNPEIGELHIVHQPGAGGSTLMRRIAYELKKENIATTVFLANFDSSLTVDMLAKLAESLKGNGRLLIVADDKEIEALNYENIKKRLKNRGIYPVFIRITHRTDLKTIASAQNTLKLRSSITDFLEQSRFDDKFKGYYLQFMPLGTVNSTLRNIHEMASPTGSGVEMIYYPYAFTDILKLKFNSKVYPTSSYVEKWFREIKDRNLKDFCGLVAFVYRFTSSKALDAYSVAKLWKNESHRTLESYGTDFNAMLHILKFSVEETNSGSSPTSLSPRYAVFAEAILDNWNPGWRNSLSIIARKFIESLPEELSQENHKSLVLDLFVQQARLLAIDMSGLSSPKLSDRFSLLIGSILDSQDGFQGARSVFETLIKKYPDNPFFKIHYGRLLYEYAHSKKYSPADKLFTDAKKYIEEALEIDEFDDFHHMAGMYWSRIATAWGRLIGTEEIDDGEIDIEGEIMECTDKALNSFSKCNELNYGSSPYGYVSAVDLLLSTISQIVRIRSIDTSNESYTDQQPFLTYLESIDEALANLERLKEEDSVSKENQLDRLRPRYLGIIGKSDRAIALTMEKYDKASFEMKQIYGHRIISMVNGSMKKDVSRREFYRNMQNSRLAELKTMLTELGDLRSTETLFTILRYTNNDEFDNGPTFDALMKWYALAMEQNDKYHILRSSYFLYICYAAQLSVDESSNRYNKEKYREYRKQCRDLVPEVPDDIFRPSLFLGKTDIRKWNSILDANEAREFNKEEGAFFYSDVCRRVDAKVMELEDDYAYCEVNALDSVSFRKGNIRKNEKGKTWLRKGVVGFRYKGPGLFKYEIDRKGTVESSENDNDFRQDSQTGHTDNDAKKQAEVQVKKTEKSNVNVKSGKTLAADKRESDIFRLDSEKRKPSVKIVGSIDLTTKGESPIRRRSHRKKQK